MTDTEKAARPRLIDHLPIDRKDNRRAKENGKETKSKIKDFLKAAYRGTDKIFLLTVILLVAFGTLMVFSAGTAYAEKRYGDIFYFVKRLFCYDIDNLALYVNNLNNGFAFE